MAQQLYNIEERRKRALLVSLCEKKKENLNDSGAGPAAAGRENIGNELLRLAQTLELEIAGQETVYVRDRQPKFGMGTGKAGELAEKAADLKADLLVFDWDPSPSQQRNWEDLAGIPVLDRQELIIQIFAKRAATREAELQVQLAELNYRLPRLTHKYIDLSRQRGGSYGTKGSGEARLETDRRLIEKRIHKLEKDIEEVAKQRQVQRRQRERQGLSVCAIVGYTNAGKSSLFNALTGSSVTVEDKLFATLDATTRRFSPAPGSAALLTDTVGFIRRLPHSLIRAFRSTLEEAARAGLLIHILDASDTEIDSCYETTVSVLSELRKGNGEPDNAELPAITVLNKIDCLKDTDQIETLLARYPQSIAVSVKTGYGLDELKKRISQRIASSVSGSDR